MYIEKSIVFLNKEDVEKHRLKTREELTLPDINLKIKRHLQKTPIESMNFRIFPNKKYFYECISCCDELWCCINYDNSGDCYCCGCECIDPECRGCMSYICWCVPCIFDFYNFWCVDNRQTKCMSGVETTIMKEACTIWFDWCCGCCYWQLNNTSMQKMYRILQDNYKDVFRVSLDGDIIVIQPL